LFKPCDHFQLQDVDPASNRQIEKQHFKKVPLINGLVEKFQEIFPYISVEEVWLIRKSKQGDGFQGWHQDKVARYTKTIVCNLGSEDIDHESGYPRDYQEDELKDVEWSLKTECWNVYKYPPKGGTFAQPFVTYEQRLLPKYSTVKDDHDVVTILSDDGDDTKSSTTRQIAMEKKKKKQENQALKHMAQSGKAALDRGCGVGAVVTLKVDYRTHSHAPGLLGVVYAFKEESGGILVCCEHGIITHDGSKSQYWVPVDKYTVVANKDTYVPISKELQAIRDLVLTGTFDMKNQKIISFSKYVDREFQSTDWFSF